LIVIKRLSKRLIISCELFSMKILMNNEDCIDGIMFEYKIMAVGIASKGKSSRNLLF
jgi:hypothetical protein